MNDDEGVVAYFMQEEDAMRYRLTQIRKAWGFRAEEKGNKHDNIAL